MIGDQDDIKRRLRLTLPTHWFGDTAPVLDGLLAGFGVVWSGLYQLLQFTVTQSRAKTATDSFLDLAALDFFGKSLTRRKAEKDGPWRARLGRAALRHRATREALIDAATEAGFSLKIFEAARPADTGAYNVPAGLAWNGAGGWGSLQMPFECLIEAKPTSDAFEDELWPSISAAMPAGGAGWIRIRA